MLYKSISTQALRRLPIYLNYLKSLPKDKVVNISATTIAEALKLNDVQVRKDLALISTGGRPKIGYITRNLIADIEKYLGFDNADSAILVGVGDLGRALLSYDGFSKYGLTIVAAFDSDEAMIGSTIFGKKVLAADKLKDLCNRMKVRIGILTVPPTEAQITCNSMIESGILAIWNFTPVPLTVPDHILIQNEDMAFSLAKLSKDLTESMRKNHCNT
ncbi:redox-sensing transcriptional repressor Rex [Anaerocolumna cellulosilytica]|uniref:Redox-sensing transcriptional repressor Rex n=1 Tax=Anaerocolumna cellulosilytica TaxID=433286 RepID=A0A6S6QSI9_9FIRM|nr:redox-sensing transcriptional repressor Rex [Anaerocolumna cellulosilytica]MBB5194724.1 redox-sensing transcriptional repressor [Anaerocolumna cellulosilytica]BCJ94313.1 redox-sensing transcriptional repressor Rex [Anaerocolumna cellulosilytica]